MHELSICQALIEQVEAVAREQNAAQVLLIRLGIGPLSGVEPQLLEQAFSIARAGSIAADAELQVTSLPIQVSCAACGSISEVQPARLVCATCGNWQTTLVSGDELQLTQVELTRKPATAAPPLAEQPAAGLTEIGYKHAGAACSRESSRLKSAPTEKQTRSKFYV